MGPTSLASPITSRARVMAQALNVRDAPSLQGAIIGLLHKDDVVEVLDATDDQAWLKIRAADVTGWSSHKFLVAASGVGSLDEIVSVAAGSRIAGFSWRDRGVAPRGYIKGMAVVFARSYCRLKSGDPFAVEMAKANTSVRAKDALAWYSAKFESLGMSNESSGVETLRHLFVLLIGLGMRESSGRFCEGRDRSATNTTAETAEAGLFQASFDARRGSPLLPQLFEEYRNGREGFLDIFKEGVHPKPSDLENFGSGDGMEFQRLAKETPAFAAEFAAVGLRNIRTHWGPITRREAEVRPECDAMLLKVQHAVESFDLCPVVL
jgi:hypothetical protein